MTRYHLEDHKVSSQGIIIAQTGGQLHKKPPMGSPALRILLKAEGRGYMFQVEAYTGSYYDQ